MRCGGRGAVTRPPPPRQVQKGLIRLGRMDAVSPDVKPYCVDLGGVGMSGQDGMRRAKVAIKESQVRPPAPCRRGHNFVLPVLVSSPVDLRTRVARLLVLLILARRMVPHLWSVSHFGPRPARPEVGLRPGLDFLTWP